MKIDSHMFQAVFPVKFSINPLHTAKFPQRILIASTLETNHISYS